MRSLFRERCPRKASLVPRESSRHFFALSNSNDFISLRRSECSFALDGNARTRAEVSSNLIKISRVSNVILSRRGFLHTSVSRYLHHITRMSQGAGNTRLSLRIVSCFTPFFFFLSQFRILKLHSRKLGRVPRVRTVLRSVRLRVSERKSMKNPVRALRRSFPSAFRRPG